MFLQIDPNFLDVLKMASFTLENNKTFVEFNHPDVQIELPAIIGDFLFIIVIVGILIRLVLQKLQQPCQLWQRFAQDPSSDIESGRAEED